MGDNEKTPNKEEKCPKIVSTKIHKSSPKTEIRVIQYEEDCNKTGEFPSTPKKFGSEACCMNPKPSFSSGRLVS